MGGMTWLILWGYFGSRLGRMYMVKNEVVGGHVVNNLHWFGACLPDITEHALFSSSQDGFRAQNDDLGLTLLLTTILATGSEYVCV